VRFFLIGILIFALSVSLRAEELVIQVQRELRARKFYFGEINGRASEETVSAIGEFQKAKGLDRTGQLDGETLWALGFPNTARETRGEADLLQECHACVLQYLKAWQSGEWEREAVFYTEVVNYYDDQNVSRDFIRDARAKELRRWPHRKATLLNRIVSLEPGRVDMAQVTARVRMEVMGESGEAQARTEDIVLRLQKTQDGWRIAALKLLE
jgi:ketosteroid isomerase-like protein